MPSNYFLTYTQFSTTDVVLHKKEKYIYNHLMIIKYTEYYTDQFKVKHTKCNIQ